MATSNPVQVFSIDSSGNVSINGSVYVLSANKANTGWIVGDMISANSKISLKNNCIVFDGTNGRVTVKDPDAPNSGTYTYINSGTLNQYYLGTLVRSLTNIESGQAKNNAETTLTGTYNVAPSVIVTPKNIQTYNATYKLQNQTFNCTLTTTSLGSGKYKIKPVATIAVAAGTDGIGLPAKYTLSAHFTEIQSAQSANVYQPTNATTFYAPEMNDGKSCVLTSPIVQTGVNCNKITVSATTTGVTVVHGGSITNAGLPVTWGKHKCRIKYKLHSASSWSYTSYSTEVTVKTFGGTSTHSMATGTLTVGNYDVAVEFVLTRSGSTEIGKSRNLEESDDAAVQVTSIQCSRAAQTLTPSGTFNYIAVGR